MFEQEHLEHAEAELTRAAQRLWELRRQALFGDYDSDEFDRAIIAYRTAVVEAKDARATTYAAGVAPAAAPSAPAGFQPSRQPGLQAPPTFRRAFAPGPSEPETVERPAAPFAPTPRMRFVKWLVETGRLSDQ